ncbi:MAG: glycosyltransferase [Paracoccaceae bacterium]
MTTSLQSDIGIIVIGRNEGERLIRCLEALTGAGRKVVYVDSGSNDGSLDAAQARGAETVALDMSVPFTAARARNEGVARLKEIADPTYIQFIDGDCEMDPNWLTTASAFLDTHPDAAVACGRLRERFPDATLYNWLCDQEWNGPTGQVKACGGIAMIRSNAFVTVGGFNAQMIAGEEPELCVRLRAAGWNIWRLPDEMALHDAAMTRFGQWWRRARRGGFTYAEGAAMHGHLPERHKVGALRSALLWGAGVPMLTLLGLFISPLSLMLLLVWPLQVIRLACKGMGWTRASFLVIAKLPEAMGAIQYFIARLRGQRTGLIEYKSGAST